MSTTIMNTPVELIPISNLHPNPDNPRKDLGDLTELAASIKAKGILQNLTVVPRFAGNKLDGYRIVIGHRRHAAAKLAGLEELPCIVACFTPQEEFETMMVENVHRSDLTVYEQAEGFQMMLDMGGSVEQVAQKTGFSETTIRRRVKLLDLDKEKFRQAEERGGTMQDYLKLQSISDPATRDKVLDTVGTPNFSVMLKNAVAKEEEAQIVAELLATMKNADWCQEVDPDTVRNHGRYTYTKAISKYNPDTKPPEDAETATYVFYAKDNYIYLYRENPKNEAADRLAEKHKIAMDEMETLHAELNEISENHMEMREEFIGNFASFNSSELDIATFAVKAMMYAADNRITIDTDRLGNLLGVPVSSDGKLDPIAWNKVLFNMPQRVLLCTAYAMLEGSGRKYNTRCYNPKSHLTAPQKTGSLPLDLIYAGLKSLDYEMSDEEKQMKDGSHYLFTRAKFLEDGYLSEMEAANGK